MKKGLFYVFAMVLFFSSCATTTKGNEMIISGKWIVDNKILNEGATMFIEFIPNSRFRLTSYSSGKKQSQSTYRYSIDGKNIFLHQRGTRDTIMPYYFNTQEILVIENFLGMILTPLELSKFNVDSNEFTTMEKRDNIEIALENASKKIMASIQQGRNTAISNVSADEQDYSDYIANELEVILLDANFVVVDRSQLDIIRQEQNFQLSGDVDDNDIISIGKYSGASYIITGSIDGTGPTRRLRLRLLDVETARVITAVSERF